MQIKTSHTGIWIVVLAAALLETTACIQYFTSRASIKREAIRLAESELRKAELEITVVTVELEAAAKTLTAFAERHLESPDSIASATRQLLLTIDHVESAGIAMVADHYPEKGHWYEICSSREEEGIFTRQIGGADHDYLQAEWFNNGLTIDSCWWSEPYYDGMGAEAMVVSCSYPIRDKSGKIVGVTCIDLSLKHLQQLSEYLQLYEDSYYTIHSNRGLAIVPDPDTIQGKRYSVMEQEIAATGWRMAIIIPDDVLYAELRKTSLIISMLMLLGLGLLIFIVTHAARTLRELISSLEKNQKMESELEVAQTIQKAMLPMVFPPFADRKDLNIYGLVNPAKEVGGDLYDFYVRHNKLFFCVGDVSGKGVPAALIMATTRSLFRSVTAGEEDAAEIVTIMNDALSEQNEQNMFITLFVGVLDMKSGELSYCNAGHNAPLRVRNQYSEISIQNSDVESMEVLPNLPLGIMKGYAYKAQQTTISKNDLLFLYTDGLTEAENSEHEQFGEERMIHRLQALRNMRPREIVEAMQADVEAFVNGAPQSDDLTLLCIRYQTEAIIMRNDIEQIPTLAEWIEGLGIPDELNMQVNLALEEIVTNVMLYAYPKDKSGQVFVEFVRGRDERGELLTFVVSDSGKEFDPTKKEEVDTTLSAEEREIGGLGIHLVRQLMDEIVYRREEGKNVLKLTKVIER